MNSVNAIVNQSFLDVSSEKGMLDFFIGSFSYSKNKTLISAQNMLSLITLNNSFVDSIWLYRKADDSLLSSKEGIIFSLKNPSVDMSKIVNSDLIYETVGAEISSRWIGTVENSVFWQERRIVSFAQTIPFFSHSSKRFGCVVINLDYDKIWAHMQSVLRFDSSMVVIDSNGEFLLEYGLKPSLISLEKEYIQEILSGEESFRVTKIAGKHVLLTWVKSDENDWMYISTIPVETLQSQINISHNFIITLLIFIVIVTLIGLIAITSHMYKPIQMILDSIYGHMYGHMESQGSDNMNNDEFMHINNVITNLNYKIDEMQDVIYKNQGIIKHKIIMDILYGNISGEADALQHLKLVNPNFLYREYAIILTDINSRVFQNLPFVQREFIIGKAIDKIDSLFSQESCCFSICYPSHCLVSIVNADSLDKIFQDKEFIIDHLYETLGQIKYNIVISRHTDTIKQLSKMYERIRGYLKYSFIYGYGNVFTEYELERIEKNNPELEAEAAPYEQLLKSNKFEELKRALSNFPHKAQSKGYSFKYTQSFILHILKMICRISKKHNVKSEEINKNALLFDFNNIDSINDCVSWMYNLINLYDESSKLKDAVIKSEFIDKIVNYITENIENGVSLNSTAEKFYVSPGYLSRLFKESTGVNFSEFLIGKKFEKTTELLMDKKKKPVSEIASLLGYSNISYFNKRFKEKFGMTPTQYRKKHSK
ncbi:MAG: AraC family transcriptional regulator [Firmicutes bacterium]|nr:AraC family transcriptional regulator [Bacillota bacterium]